VQQYSHAQCSDDIELSMRNHPQQQNKASIETTQLYHRPPRLDRNKPLCTLQGQQHHKGKQHRQQQTNTWHAGDEKLFATQINTP
jgi:hypothetical protein